MNHFKGKQFQKDVIIVAVGYYLRYNLSYRDVQEILYNRGINVSHTTVYRWVQEYGKLLYNIWKRKNKQSIYSWKMDETYIKIKGKWHYLYRAIDADGLTLDIWLRKKRDTQAAYAFLKRLVKQFDEPRVLVTDIVPSRDETNFIEAYEQPQPRLKAWKPFEDYIRRTEKKALSSGFQSARK
jgi:putative transposase